MQVVEYVSVCKSVRMCYMYVYVSARKGRGNKILLTPFTDEDIRGVTNWRFSQAGRSQKET